MKAFVTGATGFVGSAVVRALLQRDHEVAVLARPGSDRSNIADLDVQIIEGGLGDKAALERGVAGADSVFHVAADYRLWVPDPASMYAANVDATQTLMELCLRHGVTRVVYTSSVAVLGINADGSPADENVPATLEDMPGHYKRSKYLAEQQVKRLIEEHALPAMIVYPTAPVGPRDIKPTPTGRTVLDAARGRMPAYVDTGLNIVHVDDVAEGQLLALERGQPGGRYILGGEDMTLGQILAVVADIMGRQPPRIRLPHKAVLPLAHAAEAWARLTGGTTQITVDAVKMSQKKMFFSSDHARETLGYAPRPAREAIEAAIRWFRDQGYCR